MIPRTSARWSNDATTPCRQLGLGYRELRSWQRETVVHRGGPPYNLPGPLVGYPPPSRTLTASHSLIHGSSKYFVYLFPNETNKTKLAQESAVVLSVINHYQKCFFGATTTYPNAEVQKKEAIRTFVYRCLLKYVNKLVQVQFGYKNTKRTFSHPATHSDMIPHTS